MATATEETKPKKDKAAEATKRVQEALARCAGEVLMHSKQPPVVRGEIAAAMTDLGVMFAELAAKAWGGAE